MGQKQKGRNQTKSKFAKHVRRNDPCVYCLGPASTLDHIVPWSQGGSNAIDNLAPCCKRCNQARGSMGLLQFLVMRPDAPSRHRIPALSFSLGSLIKESLSVQPR